MTISQESMTSPDSAQPSPPTVTHDAGNAAPVVADGPNLSEEQAQQMLRQLGRHWGVLLSFGIVLAGLGVAFMVWPEATATVIAVLTGISLLVSGVFTLVGGVTAPEQTTGQRVLMAISGVLSILLGIFAFTSIAVALGILAIIIGVGWMIRGIFTLQSLPAKGTPGRGLTIASGILAILAALSILIWPGITLAVLIWLTGFWFVVFGLLQVFAAFKLRGISKAEESGQPTAGAVTTAAPREAPAATT